MAIRLSFQRYSTKRLHPSFSSIGGSGDLGVGPRSRPLSTSTKDSESTTSPSSGLARNRRKTAGNSASELFAMPSSTQQLTRHTTPFGKILKPSFHFGSSAIPSIALSEKVGAVRDQHWSGPMVHATTYLLDAQGIVRWRLQSKNDAAATQSDQSCQHGRCGCQKTPCAGVHRGLKKFQGTTAATNQGFRRAGEKPHKAKERIAELGVFLNEINRCRDAPKAFSQIGYESP
jgi:hypothetical protein